MQTLTIASRFIGPPSSGNGGYTCGLVATTLTDGPAEVTLRLPPPVERPLQIDVSGDVATLLDGDQVVAEARRAEVDVEVPSPVTPDEVAEAQRRLDVGEYEAEHPFPGCFTCGPARPESEGLRIFPGRVDRDQPTVGWPWTPHASLVADDGLVEPAVIWAALDCPGAGAWTTLQRTPVVLGRLAVAIDRRPTVGEPLVAAGWAIAEDGRKRLSGSALWSTDGECLARARATWIVLTEEQLRAFSGGQG